MLRSKRMYIIPFLGFTIIILIGWLLLMLPISNNGNVSPLDTLFSAVSATCVTGLTTVNIAKEYTIFGQIVVAVVTEIGAIGFVTFVSFLFNIRKRKMILSDALLLGNALSNTNYGNIKQKLIKVIKYTLVIELIGCVFLSFAFIPMYRNKNRNMV